MEGGGVEPKSINGEEENLFYSQQVENVINIEKVNIKVQIQ